MTRTTLISGNGKGGKCGFYKARVGRGVGAYSGVCDYSENKHKAVKAVLYVFARKGGKCGFYKARAGRGVGAYSGVCDYSENKHNAVKAVLYVFAKLYVFAHS